MKNKFGIGDMIYHLHAGNVWNGAVEAVQLRFGQVVYRSRVFPDVDIPEDEAYATEAEALKELIARKRERLCDTQKDVQRLEKDITALERLLEAVQ